MSDRLVEDELRRLERLRADARSDELLDDLAVLVAGDDELTAQVARRAHDQLRRLRARAEVLELLVDGELSRPTGQDDDE